MAVPANSTTTSRRLFLAAGTAAAVGASLKAAVAAIAPDPIFAAIERHRTASVYLGEVCGLADNIAAKQSGRTTTEEDIAIVDVAHEADMDALDAFVATSPTTSSGMRAMLEYGIELDGGAMSDTWGELARALLKSPVLAA